MRPAVAAAGKPQIDANVSRFPRHLAGRLHLYGDLLALGLRPLGPRAPSLHEQPGQSEIIKQYENSSNETLHYS